MGFWRTGRQTAKAGNSSAVIQIENLNIISDPAEIVRALTTDNKLARLPEIVEEARQKYRDRVQEFGEKFIERMPSESLEQLRDPAAQIPIKECAESYGATGDSDIAEISIEMLTSMIKGDIAKPTTKIFRKASKAIQSLSMSQVNLVAFYFFAQRLKMNFNETLLEILSGQVIFDEFMQKFDLLGDDIATSEFDAEVLESEGCVRNVGLGGWNLGKGFDHAYPNKIKRPFSASEMKGFVERGVPAAAFINAKFEDETFYVDPTYFPGLHFANVIAELPSDVSKDFWDRAKVGMSAKEIEIAISKRKGMEKFRTIYDVPIVKRYLITQTGTAIAIARLKQLNYSIDEKIWFPESA